MTLMEVFEMPMNHRSSVVVDILNIGIREVYKRYIIQIPLRIRKPSNIA